MAERPHQPGAAEDRMPSDDAVLRDARIDRLYRDGWHVGQIATELAISNGRVDQILRRFGHTPSIVWDGPYDNLPVSPHSRNPRRDAEIVRQVRAGRSITSLAAEFKMSAARVDRIEVDARRWHPPMETR